MKSIHKCNTFYYSCCISVAFLSSVSIHQIHQFHSSIRGSFSFYALLSLSRHSMNHILTHIVPFCTILSFQSDSSLTKYVKFVKATMLFFKRMYFLIWLTSRAMYPLNFNKIFGFVKYFEVHTNKLKV